MSDRFPEKPDFRKLGIMILILLSAIGVLLFRMLGFFDEPKEPEGIIVRFILFFKLGNFL